MMNKLKHRLLASSGFAASLIAIFAGLFVGFIILLITNPDQAVDGFVTILKGGFTGGAKGIGNIFYLATPIIMTGLSVGFAFKTGLFNIGASGQLIVGGYVAVLIGVLAPGLGSFHWVIALIGGMAAGALWAFIPGLLKALFNVHEVISSIMMNYIGMFMVNALVAETVFDSLRAQSLPVAQSAQMPTLGMDTLFKGSSVNAGIFVAILFVIVLYIILNKTTFGYELKACGFNKDASRYAGINAKRNIILSMTIAGAMAGVAGGLIYLAGSGKFIEIVDVLAMEGFTGISVALLASSNPIGVLFTGIFVSYITNGGFYMQLYDFVPEIIDIIISIIIYFSALALIVRHFFDRYALKSGLGDDDIPAPKVEPKRKRRIGLKNKEVDKDE
ncbi:MAG: ABC transporter permease [Clostridia bacterium]|jgi:general nucleoside transport system permease protein|nr:ABC transporter permease [Clostridia bacterium]MBT7121990.1 ABC transporter permease [Clostridia bacterium]